MVGGEKPIQNNPPVKGTILLMAKKIQLMW